MTANNGLTSRQNEQATSSAVCFLLMIVIGIGAVIAHAATPTVKSEAATVAIAR